MKHPLLNVDLFQSRNNIGGDLHGYDRSAFQLLEGRRKTEHPFCFLFSRKVIPF